MPINNFCLVYFFRHNKSDFCSFQLFPTTYLIYYLLLLSVFQKKSYMIPNFKNKGFFIQTFNPYLTPLNVEFYKRRNILYLLTFIQQLKNRSFMFRTPKIDFLTIFQLLFYPLRGCLQYRFNIFSKFQTYIVSGLRWVLICQPRWNINVLFIICFK